MAPAGLGAWVAPGRARSGPTAMGHPMAALGPASGLGGTLGAPGPVSPSRLEGEARGVAAIAAQRAEGPGEQLEARVVRVPEVDVFVGDLQLALAVHVQVGAGEEEHVEPVWGKKKSIIIIHWKKKKNHPEKPKISAWPQRA